MEAHKEAVNIMDPAGDTIINCCDEAGDILDSFLVASKALSLSSPVFRAMLDLSKPYNQSKAGSSGKHEVKLALGHPRLMGIVFHILHHQNKHVPVKFSLEDLTLLAEICDFYDLSEALRPWVLQWIQHLWVSGGKCSDLGLWFRIAIAFSVVNILDQITIQLVKKCRKNGQEVISPLGGSDFPCSVPQTLPGKLWQKREELSAILIQQLEKICKAYKEVAFADSSVCQVDRGTARRCDDSQLAAVCRIGIALGYPVLGWNAVSLEEILNAFESVQSGGSEITYYYKSHAYMDQGNHAGCCVAGKIREAAKDVHQTLRCITYDMVNECSV
ncbi:hypothetical protein TWF481_006253 [Arthrobotrys musiformis]|uniref:BTB domain-containing protein n=1 Tax=Arthrobotrys musiformis TaxID=47236 RepID=A0AAV9WHS0_9PEZI